MAHHMSGAPLVSIPFIALFLVVFDVCSPMSAEACSEYHYVLTSQMIRVDVENIYLMKHKSELLNGSSNFRVK